MLNSNKLCLFNRQFLLGKENILTSESKTESEKKSKKWTNSVTPVYCFQRNVFAAMFYGKCQYLENDVHSYLTGCLL